MAMPDQVFQELARVLPQPQRRSGVVRLRRRGVGIDGEGVLVGGVLLTVAEVDAAASAHRAVLQGRRA